mmetsp:Transcript_9731/g.36202  ORF Transcript_9731/g.36202 Transcript_9731/m.36202 type:complete len:106 (-) Transcript_9731:1870-2187(-)
MKIFVYTRVCPSTLFWRTKVTNWHNLRWRMARRTDHIQLLPDSRITSQGNEREDERRLQMVDTLQVIRQLALLLEDHLDCQSLMSLLISEKCSSSHTSQGDFSFH